jgi:hypothetical protein
MVSAVSGGVVSLVLGLAIARSVALGALLALVGALGGAVLAPILMFAWSFMCWPTRMLVSIDARLSEAEEAERPPPILAELEALSTEADMLLVSAPFDQRDGWPPNFTPQLLEWEGRAGEVLGRYYEVFQQRFLAEPSFDYEPDALNLARQRLRKRHEILNLAIQRLRHTS